MSHLESEQEWFPLKLLSFSLSRSLLDVPSLLTLLAGVQEEIDALQEEADAIVKFWQAPRMSFSCAPLACHKPDEPACVQVMNPAHIREL